MASEEHQAERTVTALERHLPPVAQSVREAREFVLRAGEVPEDDAYDIALLVSEIASNAVLHARTDFVVRVDRDDTVLRVEITDGFATLPVSKHHGPESPTGRGMHIVDALAQRWGVEPRAGGKAVWFETELEAHADA